MILRNPLAGYILRNLEKFENSIKYIFFFIREIGANFNNFQGITPNFNREKSILVCQKFKIWLYYMKVLSCKSFV